MLYDKKNNASGVMNTNMIKHNHMMNGIHSHGFPSMAL
jgi:hypothetical protein